MEALKQHAFVDGIISTLARLRGRHDPPSGRSSVVIRLIQIPMDTRINQITEQQSEVGSQQYASRKKRRESCKNAE